MTIQRRSKGGRIPPKELPLEEGRKRKKKKKGKKNKRAMVPFEEMTNMDHAEAATEAAIAAGKSLIRAYRKDPVVKGVTDVLKGLLED